VQPESQLNERLDAPRLYQQAESGMETSPQLQNKPTDPGPTFDMEETADIILPIDHPIFTRRHGSR
jgi:hypothetical protein